MTDQTTRVWAGLVTTVPGRRGESAAEAVRGTLERLAETHGWDLHVLDAGTAMTREQDPPS